MPQEAHLVFKIIYIYPKITETGLADNQGVNITIRRRRLISFPGALGPQ